MGAGASLSVDKWSSHRLSKYASQKNLPTYVTKIIKSKEINGTAILNFSEYDMSRLTNEVGRQKELWKHCKMIQRISSRNRSKNTSNDDTESQISEHSNRNYIDSRSPPTDELCNLPFHLRNRYFTGRKVDLEILEDAFFHDDGTGKRCSDGINLKCFAISGLGGIGKTALAARYAEKMYYDKFKYTGGVYFLNGDNDAVLHNGYIDLAIYQLHIKAAKNEKQIDRIISYVHTWFRRHKNWLLIIDNVDENEAFTTLLDNRFFPPIKAFGHVIVTSRNQDHMFFKQDQFINDKKYPMVLSKLSHRSSCEFLFRRSSQKYISEFETMQGLKLLERKIQRNITRYSLAKME